MFKDIIGKQNCPTHNKIHSVHNLIKQTTRNAKRVQSKIQNENTIQTEQGKKMNPLKLIQKIKQVIDLIDIDIVIIYSKS